MNTKNTLGITLVAIIFAAGCHGFGKKQAADDQAANQVKSDMKSDANQMKTAIATIRPSRAATTQASNNNVMGTVMFAQVPDGVKITIALTGLAPDSTHGFHIHEKGDVSAPDLSSAGGHFNPAGHKHGGPQSAMSHAGDLGNITADANGAVNIELTVPGLTLDNNPLTGIINRSVIVHAKEDDLKTDPSGNSGARVAGGVILTK
jgi:superoxide dismutase, Cu-Zn family